MKISVHVLCMTSVLLGVSATVPVAAQTAAAYVLEDIDIDGDLDDWPEDMPTYLISTPTTVYGRSDIHDTDLATSRDLSPRFQMGYDPDEDILYLGVVVRDDVLQTSPNIQESDACEVYVSGLAGLNPMQYVMVPGRTSGFSPNPALIYNDIGRTRTRGASRRSGDVTVYEWAIEVFDEYPDHTTDLDGGTNIGFDVVIVDRDASGPTAWIPWGPSQGGKVGGDDRIGRVVLSHMGAEDMAELRAELGEVGVEVREAVREIFHESPELATEAHALAAEVQALAAEAQVLAAERMVSRSHQVSERHREQVEKHARLAEKMADQVTRRIIIDGDGVQLEGLDVVIPAMPAMPEMPAPYGVHALSPELRALEAYNDAREKGEDIGETVVGGLIAMGVILSAGLSVGLAVLLIRRSGGRRDGEDEEGLDDLTGRLEAIERRLTDTQEVMLALSERYDDLDGNGPPRTGGEE